MKTLVATLVAALLGCASSRADTFTVTTADSLGAGSLAQAIDLANAHPGPDTIAFRIPGSGVQKINVGDFGLPEITDPLTIDGYTQPGARANRLRQGDDAIVLIRLDGRYSGEPHHGLIISAGASTVRGLALTGFPNVFNFLTGEPLFNGTAIILQGSGQNVITGNFIGFSSDELQDGYNSTGLGISSSNNTVGGTLPAARNVISHNQVGIEIDPGASGNVLQGNYFGTEPDGSSEMGNGVGLFVDGEANEIGGRTAEAGNLISGSQFGIILGRLGSGNVVEGNTIGAVMGAADDLANSSAGILIEGSNNLIGGLEPGAGNHIGYNPVGVQVVQRDADHPAVGNSILSNIIGASTKIDLARESFPDDATRNDLGDEDTGANNLQNFPIITSTSFQTGHTVVKGGLNSTPSTRFTLQFFTETLHATEGGTTYLEGPVFATKTVTTDAAGIAYFQYNFPPMPSDVAITATATDAAGNTSEFQADTTVQLANISTRGHVGKDDNLLVGGFVVHRPLGNVPASFRKRVLLRALGPSLSDGGKRLPGRLQDPTLELRNARGSLIAENDNWRSTQEAAIQATGAAPSSDREAALIASLPDGNYTVQVRGVNGGVGLGVVEVYDLDPLDPVNEFSGRLVNISTRGLVRPGDDALIGGLIVRGDSGQDLLIRAIGPDLAGLEVPNALADPTLELRDASGTLLASNDNWREGDAAQISATGLAPNDDRDAAILATLIPGSYTAIVRGVAGSSGLALVEFFDLDQTH